MAKLVFYKDGDTLEEYAITGRKECLPYNKATHLKRWETLLPQLPFQDAADILSKGFDHIEIGALNPDGFTSEDLAKRTQPMYCEYFDSKNRSIGRIDFSLDLKNKETEFTFIHLEPDKKGKSRRGQGIGTQIFDNLVTFSDRLGANRINMLVDEEDGPYVWAACGGVPNPESWNGYRLKLIEKLAGMSDVPDDKRDSLMQALESDNPKVIWTIAKTPVWGKKLLSQPALDEDHLDLDEDAAIERALDRIGWDGYLDLKDPDAMTMYHEYMDSHALTRKTSAPKSGERGK